MEYQSGIVHLLAQFRERGGVHLAVGYPRVDAFSAQLLDEQQFVVVGAGGDTDREVLASSSSPSISFGEMRLTNPDISKEPFYYGLSDL